MKTLEQRKAKKLYMQDWVSKNQEKVKAYRKEYDKEYRIKHAEKIAENKAEDYRQDGLFKYNLKKFVSVTPAWANLGYIKLFYRIAQEERDAGNRVEIDHIVPINNPLVCGLHNEWNLQVAHRIYNNQKKDRFWPDMPEYSFTDYEELYGKRFGYTT